jgi:hypothetical protein
MWNIPVDISAILKRYIGEIKPNVLNPKDKRRMFASEFSEKEQSDILL